MAVLQLPVRSDFKAYDFQIQLEGATYTLRFTFNERMEIWIMSIADSADVEILSSIPIFTNLPLIQQFTIDGLPPGEFIALDETGENRDAGFNDLGNDIKLFYSESNEVNQ